VCGQFQRAHFLYGRKVLKTVFHGS
jgi:hypothetical protein